MWDLVSGVETKDNFFKDHFWIRFIYCFSSSKLYRNIDAWVQIRIRIRNTDPNPDPTTQKNRYQEAYWQLQFVCRIKECAYFAPIHEQMEQLMDPATFVGRAPQQVPVPVYTELQYWRFLLYLKENCISSLFSYIHQTCEMNFDFWLNRIKKFSLAFLLFYPAVFGMSIL